MGTVAPGDTLSFTWNPQDWCFVWGVTGLYKDNAVFEPNQVWPADPSVIGPATESAPGNQVRLGELGFEPATFVTNPQPGVLYLQTGDDIPTNVIALGIGLTGVPTYGTQAIPNTITEVPTDNPILWVLEHRAGTVNLRPGLVFDIVAHRPTIPTPEFPPGGDTASVTIET